MRRLQCLLAAVVALLSATAGCASSMTRSESPGQGPPRAGQMVFIPWESGDLARAQGFTESSAIEVLACESGPNGLRVDGHVTPPGPKTVAVGAVSGRDLDIAGVRVGFNNLTDQSVPETTPGDFRVTLPWAAEGSLFGIVENGSVVDGVVACP